MIPLHILVVVLSVALIVGVFLSALRTFVAPRAIYDRLTTAVFVRQSPHCRPRTVRNDTIDRARLDRALQNLIGNAITYSPTAAPVVVAVTRGVAARQPLRDAPLRTLAYVHLCRALNVQ